jgi:hypothetical protein
MTENRAAKPGKSGSLTIWALITFTVGLVTRLLMVFLYQPVTYSDTPSYRRLAEAVLGGFARYDGTRTPGYPVFLALVGDDQRVWLVQLLLGLFTTMLLFYMAWKLTGKPWFSGLIGLVHTLNLGQLFFESNLLTESLTTFMLVLTLVVMLVWLDNPRSRSLGLAAFIGLASTLTLLVRPLFIYLPFYTLIVLGLSSQLTKQAASEENGLTGGIDGKVTINHPSWRHAIAFLVPVILLLGGWLTFIHTKYGDWALTTMTGYHLIQHTGSYFEAVPDEYAALRDTYIQFRDAQIARLGTQTNAIWEAIPEMSQVSGYNFYDLSRVLTRLSLQLIAKHPLLFLQNAFQGWWMFWRTAVYWSGDALRLSWLAGGVSASIQVQRAVLFLVNLVFIFASLAAGIMSALPKLRHRSSQAILHFVGSAQHIFFWFLAGTIWIASILQTLLDHGDNPRFLVPMQSLVVLWVALFFYSMYRIKFSPVKDEGSVKMTRVSAGDGKHV